MNPLIRVGVDGGRRFVLDRCIQIGAPILISANTLWNNRRKAFRVSNAYAGMDVALDSGGFVAMKLYGGYRWTVDQYAALAKQLTPTWWAQMDFCCEPEIAASRVDVAKRVERTVEHLMACQVAALDAAIPMPMPVLQGWEPADYCHGPIYQWACWPDLVGVGSVCRRALRGSNGLLAVIDAIDRAIPKHVRLHLFGVKSAGMKALTKDFPNRIASMDSMAWNVEARWHNRRSGQPRTKQKDAAVMETWYRKQKEAVQPHPQRTLEL